MWLIHRPGLATPAIDHYHYQYSFAEYLVLTKKAELNLKRRTGIPTNQHRPIVTSHVFLCVKTSLHKSCLIQAICVQLSHSGLPFSGLK